MEWILVVLLLSPSGYPTRFEVEHRFEMKALCTTKSDELQLTWDSVVGRKEYLESWCEHESQRIEMFLS